MKISFIIFQIKSHINQVKCTNQPNWNEKKMRKIRIDNFAHSSAEDYGNFYVVCSVNCSPQSDDDDNVKMQIHTRRLKIYLY